MAINTLELKRAMLAQIGAEGTQRYTDARDIIPAMNGAQRRFEALAAPLLADRKGSEESLSELQETRVIQTNIQGGISLDSLWLTPTTTIDYEIWTVIALIAEPTTFPGTYTPMPQPAKSWLRLDRIYQPGGAEERPVKRMTMEQVAAARDNFTQAGNEVLAATGRRTYGYYMMGNRTDNDALLNGSREIVLTPNSLFTTAPPKLVVMSYLRSAPVITQIDANTNIPYPVSLFTIIRDLALNELTPKQGNQTTLYQITEREIGRLLGIQN